MRPADSQALITAVFEAAEHAMKRVTYFVPDLRRDRTEYTITSALLEEAWVAAR